MDPLVEYSCWDFLDCIDEAVNSDFLLSNNNNLSGGVPGDVDFSFCVDGDRSSTGGGGGGVPSQEKECSRKRGRSSSCNRAESKACREKLRREKLNDRHALLTGFGFVFSNLFLDLSAVLDPGRPARTDKPAIIDDAIRVLNQLRNEAQELKDTNEKLLEEIKSLKAEKNELREEKLMLKVDKERMEQQLKAAAVPPSGFMPAHPAAYHPAPSKMPVFPGYSLIPMWQYLPPATCDTSRDHELRPPAA
ncbi:hypothetical protein Tsubulata_021878 [Turnera subulata]|uniref:BHLH domain-containing protein n=1 Tax=Turnera subulata TaxID=218843 RepID=A0A9Q0F9B2_9ROSI|nr:hypothetical protein Tsubulata_021878 [Turnera subulata]